MEMDNLMCCRDVQKMNGTTTTDCTSCDDIMFIDTLSTVLVVVLLITIFAITVVVVSLICLYYNHQKRKKAILPLHENGEVKNPEVLYSALENSVKQAPTQNINSSLKSIPLTEDGYAMLDHECPEDNCAQRLSESSNLQWDGDNSGENVHPVIVEAHYEMSGEWSAEAKDDNYDYVEPYWEPANQEDELMSQLSRLKLKEISTECLELKEFLGSGQFGKVHRGLWFEGGGEYKQEIEKEVAVKSIEQGTSDTDRVKFLQEAAIMGQFCHANVLQLVGIVLTDPMMIVVEFMPKGDLHHHLISLRQEAIEDQIKLGALLLSYTRQITLGMAYLSKKEFIHRDLAARNVLVSDEGICKIADFGLSRNLQNGDYYVSQGGKIPVKWTAPEALHYRKYSTASDVWSYGCLLYEVWSLGCKPFHDLTNAQVIPKVDSGYRLSPPPGSPRNIYQIMINCWNQTPAKRPDFCDTLFILQQPDFHILKWSESDLSTCDSDKARIIGSPISAGFCLYQDLQNTYRA